MKTIPSATAVAAVSVFLAGCSTAAMQATSVRQVAPAAGEPVMCPKVDGGKRLPVVYVDVQYAADGTPSAVPDTCYVDSGATVVWRDPPDRTTAFNLVFSDRVTGTKGGLLGASRAATGYSLSAVINGNPAERIKYGIQANGKTVDPAIIIKRSQ